MKYLNHLLLICCISFYSCAYHHGTLTGNAALSGGNFKMLKPAYGYAQTTHVLGIGGLKKQALVHEARKNLYAMFPLEANQAYANIAVDFKRSFFPFIGRTQVFVTADVVLFEDNVASPMPKKNEDKSTVAFLFEVNDEVIVFLNDKMRHGVVYNVFDKGLKVVFDDLSIKRLSYDLVDSTSIFLSDKKKRIANSHFQIGDYVQRAGHDTKVEIIGLAKLAALVIDQGEILIVDYADLTRDK